jgi:hemoglobin
MSAAPVDIATPADIDCLVAAFYRKLLSDPILGFLFTDIARIDLDEHLPRVSAFWQQQILGRPGYRGQTFAVHSALHSRVALTAEHFHRWLFLFEQTIDELFDGSQRSRAHYRCFDAAGFGAAPCTRIRRIDRRASAHSRAIARLFTPRIGSAANSSHI